MCTPAVSSYHLSYTLSPEQVPFHLLYNAILLASLGQTLLIIAQGIVASVYAPFPSYTLVIIVPMQKRV